MKRLVRPGILAFLVVSITAQHYAVAPSVHNLWLHNIHYLLYFLPILMCAIWYGLVGGITASIIVSILYAPVPFGQLGHHALTSGAQRILELVIYNVVGLVTGLLSERERRQRDHSARIAAELKQASCLAAVGQMVSMAAHEIRNPLQSIRIGIEIMSSEIGLGEERIELLKDIEKGLDTLDEIVSDFLDYSKPTMLSLSSVSAHDLVRLALKTSARKLAHISVVMYLEGGEEKITLDVAKFVRLLTNFISNAAEAMPNGGDLTIRSRFYTDKGARFLAVTVADTGCGMDDAHLKRIDEPFFTTKHRGTGLGIPICRKIVEAHGGSYAIASAVGTGTTVEIIVPVRKGKDANNGARCPHDRSIGATKGDETNGNRKILSGVRETNHRGRNVFHKGV